jgi:hypothetical protein
LVRGRSCFRHYLTAMPYQRFFRRLYRTASEKLMVKAYQNDKSLLDQLYQADILANKH